MAITAGTMQLAVSLAPKHITHHFVVVKQFGFSVLLGHHHDFLSRMHAVLDFRQGIVSLSCGACGKVEVVTVGQLMSEELRPII